MKRTKLFFAALITSVMLFSCTDGKNNKLIIGNWQGAEWLVNGDASQRNAAQTSFSFDDKGNYNFNYADNKETGTYKVENEMLFTTPAKQNEIMVKIVKLTHDSLVFDMNRGGQPETLTLLKK